MTPGLRRTWSIKGLPPLARPIHKTNTPWGTRCNRATMGWPAMAMPKRPWARVAIKPPSIGLPLLSQNEHDPGFASHAGHQGLASVGQAKARNEHAPVRTSYSGHQSWRPLASAKRKTNMPLGYASQSGNQGLASLAHAKARNGHVRGHATDADHQGLSCIGQAIAKMHISWSARRNRATKVCLQWHDQSAKRT